MDASNPLIVQADRSIYLETFNPRAEEARAAISPFAELEKSPEHLHTYRLTPLSLWNAASSGQQSSVMVEVLRRFSKFPVPENVVTDIQDLVGRWGRVRLLEGDPCWRSRSSRGMRRSCSRCPSTSGSRLSWGSSLRHCQLNRFRSS